MTDALFPQALVSDLGRDVYAPCVSLWVGGMRAAPDLEASLTEVSVTLERGVPGSFSISLNDPELRWVAARGPLARGNEVSIDLGYNGQPQRVFTGFIGQISAEFPEAGPPVVRVDGYDASHGLTQHTRQSVYSGARTDQGLPDSEVFSEVASRHNLRSAAPASERRQRPRVQANETDFDFLHMIAAEGDRDLFVDPDGVLRFAHEADDSRPALRLTWGRNLTSFGGRRSDVGQLDKVEVRGWDPGQKTALVGTASAEQAGGRGQSRTLVVDNADVDGLNEADRMAAALLEQRRRAGQSAHGSTVGDTSLTVGRRVQVSGVGQFDGTYVLTSVSHRFGTTGFVSSFHAEQVANGSGAPSRALGSAGEHAPGPTRTISGVVPGVVLDDPDPAEQARVRVHVPVLGEDVKFWARVAVPLAGRGRGSLWLPRTGDEVLVAFELGDPARPYVVGSLWSQEDPPPEVEQDVREVLLLRTIAGHVLEFVDTDGARKISLLDADGNGVVIDTEAGTVTLQAAKGISLEVPEGSLETKSADATVHTTSDLAVDSGGNQTFKAQATSTIKGSTVRIN